jgi:hypothetical protein
MTLILVLDRDNGGGIGVDGASMLGSGLVESLLVLVVDGLELAGVGDPGIRGVGREGGSAGEGNA